MTRIDGHKVHDISFNDVLEIMRAHGYKDINSLSRMPDNPMQWKKEEWDLVFHLVAGCLKKKVDDAKKLNATTLVKILDFAFKSARIYNIVQSLMTQQMIIASTMGAHASETKLTGLEPGGEVRGEK